MFTFVIAFIPVILSELQGYNLDVNISIGSIVAQ